MLYFFEDFALDTDRRELSRRDVLIAVQPQVFDVLEYLIVNRNRVVSRDDILKSVWHGRTVSESALTTRINAVRSALDDRGKERRLIRTFSRKGIRFVGAVSEEHELTGRNGAIVGASRRGVAAEQSAPSVSVSIVVLPFTNIGGDLEQEYFVDGVTESLTTDVTYRRIIRDRAQ